VLSVALVCPYDLSVPGGVQYQVLGLAGELARRSLPVTVVAPGDPRDERPPGVNFVPVGRAIPVPANGSLAPVCLSPLAARRAALELRRGAFDVVHVHEPMTPLVGLAGLVAARAPVLATFHRSGLDRLYRAEALALRPLAGRIRTAVAVSDPAKATVTEALGLRRVEIVPNGVVLSEGRSDGGGAPAREERQPTVTYLGRHEARKGLAVLLEAFGRVTRPARLVVMSDGPLTPSLRERYPSSERIEWVGTVDSATKRRLLASADVVCVPSLGGESFGVVLLEAMAASTAVVASDIPGYRLAAGDAALLVPPGDPTALAEALEGLLDDPVARRRLAEAGVRRAEEHSMRRVADRYLGLYSAIAS
jgi:phosphatidylinositol alpha-mannosyltransferase